MARSSASKDIFINLDLPQSSNGPSLPEYSWVIDSKYPTELAIQWRKHRGIEPVILEARARGPDGRKILLSSGLSFKIMNALRDDGDRERLEKELRDVKEQNKAMASKCDMLTSERDAIWMLYEHDLARR